MRDLIERPLNENEMDMVVTVGSMIEEIIAEQLDTLNDAVFVQSVVIAHILATHGYPEEELNEALATILVNIASHYHFFKKQQLSDN
jgi:hypothetical protein